ncbi:hypothetical protein [uncultured Pseudoflavonifractor sp.]|uniref:hypothetical protein n=1 Tax=uncultured Pseudoflavonifractor sp. TaxID=1221379 RepID=UPI0025D2D13C|nr:hypothetical protein [uncultured Pseudoflavonifractor sp.]
MNGPGLPAVLQKKTPEELDCHRRKIKVFRKKPVTIKRSFRFLLQSAGNAVLTAAQYGLRNEKENSGRK